MKNTLSPTGVWIFLVVLGMLAQSTSDVLFAQQKLPAKVSSQLDDSTELTKKDLAKLQDEIAATVQKAIQATVSLRFGAQDGAAHLL